MKVRKVNTLHQIGKYKKAYIRLQNDGDALNLASKKGILWLIYLLEPLLKLFWQINYQAELNLEMALVASMMAWLPKSAGRINLTAVWMSLEDKVFFLLYLTSLEASRATLSNISVTKEFKTFIPFLEIPMSLAMLFKTLKMYNAKLWKFFFLFFFWITFLAMLLLKEGKNHLYSPIFIFDSIGCFKG